MCESIFWALIDEVLQPVDVEKYGHALEAKLERISTSLFKYNRETQVFRDYSAKVEAKLTQGCIISEPGTRMPMEQLKTDEGTVDAFCMPLIITQQRI